MGQKKLSMNKRRGVSNIIGSLIVLAIVASVGSVILFQGLNQINAFNYDLTLHDSEHVNQLREDIVFEHVTFDPRPGPDGTEVYLYLANIGSVDSTIQTVTIVKIDTQDLILRETPDASDATILVEDHIMITLENAVLAAAPNDIWDSADYGPTNPLPTYKITVTTSKGNSYSTIAEPFNS